MKEQPEGVAHLRKIIDGSLRVPLLLVGEEGVGRRFSVIQAVKEAVTKGNPSNPFGVQVERGIHPDFTVVTSPDKDIGIEVVRSVVERSYDHPMISKRRYILIDGVDRMTSAAANAFLKTLEEPPSTTQFFLLAESEKAVLSTIRSRCGRVRYKRLSDDFIVEFLKDVEPDPARALLCARLSGGSVGRAFHYLRSGRLELRDRVLDLLRMGVSGDWPAVFSLIDNRKADLDTLIRFIDHVLYDLSMLPFAPTRLVNHDKFAELSVLRQQLGPVKLEALRSSLETVRNRAASGNINLIFHLKSAIASALSQ